MNGYTSANVAPTLDGVKSLIRAQPPNVVMADPDIIRDAPYEMTTAGLGDVLAKSVSSADWFLNHFLFGDYFCEQAVSLISDIEHLYLDNPENVRARDPDALSTLFNALLLTGAAMTMAETSAPSSGGEHLISHTLDMMAYVQETPHDLHGRQVGVGTVLASELYDRIIKCESPDLLQSSMEIDSGFWGPLQDAVLNQYSQKKDRIERTVKLLSKGDTWDCLREDLQDYIRAPSMVSDTLKKAGAAYTAGDLGYSLDTLLAALLHAHEIRSRFTILDLARLAGILPRAASGIIEQWA
jgi:glycerol-1-phosphate dehydrogenase [NAD(P)+]